MNPGTGVLGNPPVRAALGLETGAPNGFGAPQTGTDPEFEPEIGQIELPDGPFGPCGWGC